MRQKRVVSMAVFLTICLVLTGFAQGEPIGKVDWVNGYVSGFGIGLAESGTNKGLARTSSIRAARVDALRNLLKTIHRMRIDPSIRVETYITSKGAANTRVKGLLKGAQMVDHKTQWLNDSPLTIVEMRVCIGTYGKGCSNGDSLNSALDLVAFRSPQQPPGQGPAGKTAIFDSSSAGSATGYDADKPVTGAVFSLGGLSYERDLLPRIVTKGEGGIQIVYSAHSVEPSIVRSLGILRFTDTLDQARGVENIGGNYLMVPVESIGEDNALVISNASAQRIHASTRGGNDYLRKARVVVSAE